MSAALSTGHSWGKLHKVLKQMPPWPLPLLECHFSLHTAPCFSFSSFLKVNMWNQLLDTQSCKHSCKEHWLHCFAIRQSTLPSLWQYHHQLSALSWMLAFSATQLLVLAHLQMHLNSLDGSSTVRSLEIRKMYHTFVTGLTSSAGSASISVGSAQLWWCLCPIFPKDWCSFGKNYSI